MLELCNLELQLVDVRTRDEPELLEESFEARAGPLAGPDGLVALAARRLLDQLTRLVAAHSAGHRQLVRERVRSLGGQRHRTERREPEALE